MSNKTFAACPCPTSSPWGHVQERKQIAPGLWSVSTASHGGLYLSPQRFAAYRKCFPTFEGYAGGNWLEEDCDYCLAPLAFPDCFSPEQIFFAVRTVLTYKSLVPHDPDYFAEPRAWLESDAGAQLRKVAADFEATRAGMWEAGGCSTSGKGWMVFLYRGEERATIHCKEYNTQNWFTDAEVEALRNPFRCECGSDATWHGDRSGRRVLSCETCWPAIAKREGMEDSREAETTRPVPFNENDCGGVFDGYRVVSDADPGL